MGEEKKPNSSPDAISKKIHHKKELVEWLEVQILSSSPSTSNEHKNKNQMEENNQAKSRNPLS
jgi:hypothetical protein